MAKHPRIVKLMAEAGFGLFLLVMKQLITSE